MEKKMKTKKSGGTRKRSRVIARRAKPSLEKEYGVYAMKVTFLSGPEDAMNEEFLRGNPVVSRTLHLRGDHVLDTLHNAVFRAFDREEDWGLYEFQIGGRHPGDGNARTYVRNDSLAPHPSGDEKRWGGDASRTTLDELGLQVHDRFFYEWDTGWWHEVEVIQAGKAAWDKAPSFPEILARTGANPPQYPDFEEE